MADTKIRRTDESPIRYGQLDVKKDDEIDVPRGVAGQLVRGGGWAFVKKSDATAETTSADSVSTTPSSRTSGHK